MSKYSLKVNINPYRAFSLIKERETADLVHEEFFDFGDGRCVGTLIYEKYYMRVSNRATLTVLINNFYGYTEVKAIATGSSQGILFNFDWGASNNFANSIKTILNEYIEIT